MEFQLPKIPDTSFQVELNAEKYEDAQRNIRSIEIVVEQTGELIAEFAGRFYCFLSNTGLH